MGTPKGLLAYEGETLLERTSSLVRALQLPAVLVGANAAYAALSARLGLESVADQPPGIGPLGGLAALLERAHERGVSEIVMLACDMPFLALSVLERLLGTHLDASARRSIVAPKRGDRWEPFCARLLVAPIRPLVASALDRGDHSLQRLFDRAGVVALELDAADSGTLDDWDTPEDMRLRCTAIRTTK